MSLAPTPLSTGVPTGRRVRSARTGGPRRRLRTPIRRNRLEPLVRRGAWDTPSEQAMRTISGVPAKYR